MRVLRASWLPIAFLVLLSLGAIATAAYETVYLGNVEVYHEEEEVSEEETGVGESEEKIDTSEEGLEKVDEEETEEETL